MNIALHPDCTRALLLVRLGNNISACFIHASNRHSETMLTCIKKGKADDNGKHMKPILFGVNLSSANLSSADLTLAVLMYVDLESADLTSAKLNSTTFINCLIFQNLKCDEADF